MQSSKKIARRDKKVFLSEQCKETEENNRMGKTRDLFKKIRDINGTFHANMVTIKDRNGMDICVFIKTCVYAYIFSFTYYCFLKWYLALHVFSERYII